MSSSITLSTPLLTVEDLKTYLCVGKDESVESNTVKAVDGVSFTIDKGETLCLVGESGSGKSMCALSVIQLLPQGISHHPSGSIQLQLDNSPVDLLNASEEQLMKIRGYQIAMIFQEPMTSLNPVFTVGEQIIEALLLHHPSMLEDDAKQKAITAMRQVKIKDAEERFNSYPHQMSGGQRQRVMIAMALACEPDLLIADEPTTALDVTVQAEILQLMRELQQDTGMSILFITHDFGVVSEMAHKVAVMQQGKIVEQGDTKTLLKTPSHSYTQKLLASVPDNLKKPENLRSQTITDIGNLESLVSVKDLHVWFPIKKGLMKRVVDHVRAVDDISLEVPKGKIVSLVGESGCGKTTLGRAILQLLPVTSGSVVYNEQELVGMPEKQLRSIRPKLQIAFQDPHSSLNPRLHVSSTLTEPMAVHGIGESDEHRLELAADILEQMHLKREHLWRFPHEFSGGQRQRIGLARALVLNPEFIVCDEITSALDVSVQAEILQLLLEIRQQKDLTLLFITHNIAVVEYLSDITVVMKAGKIVEQGMTADICGNPQEAYTQKLLAAVPRLKL